jgi:hypothetical protein
MYFFMTIATKMVWVSSYSASNENLSLNITTALAFSTRHRLRSVGSKELPSIY